MCNPSTRGAPAPSSLPPAWSGEAGGWPPVPGDHPLLLCPDCIRIARCFEATRQRCCRLEQDGRRAREQLARVEAERAALEVKLKHARNQVEVEMKKRHRAEAELEKQVGGWPQGTLRGWLRGPQPAHHQPVSLAGAKTSIGPRVADAGAMGQRGTEQGAVLCSQCPGWPAPWGSLGTHQEVSRSSPQPLGQPWGQLCPSPPHHCWA